MVRSPRPGLFLILVALSPLFAGCAPFLGPPPPEGPAAYDDAARLGHSWLKKKQMVEARGRWEDGSFVAARLKIEKEDHEVEMKGTLTAIAAEEVRVGGARLVLGPETKFAAEGRDHAEAADFEPGAWVKAETVLRDERLLVRKLTLRTRKEGEEEELQGLIEQVDRKRGELTIGDIPVKFARTVPLTWEVKDVPPPAPELRDHQVLPEMDGLDRVRSRDPEDWRPANQFRPVEGLTIGGEAKFESEWRNNDDLQDSRNRDRLIHEVSVLLEASVRYTRNVYSFTRLRLGKGIVHFDEERDFEENGTIELSEMYLLLEDLPVPGVSLQLGKQDIDDRGREWAFDDQLEAIRAWFNFDVAVLELSASRKIFEPAPEEDDVTNLMAAVHFEPVPEIQLLGYVVHRLGGTDEFHDLDRTHVGAGAELDFGGFRAWADAGWTFGQEDDLDIDGLGADVLVRYGFDALPLRPALLAGIAYGSGDRDPFDGDDSRFRQTGLNDNQDRLDGVFSFRYLGEMSRFELQNLVVLTAGTSFRLLPDTSLHLLWHHYRQEYAFAGLGESRLRRTPNGEEKDLGTEFDVILGVFSLRPLTFEVVLGYFQAGPAFSPAGDDAWFATFELKYSF